jgi:hypothetical protein
LVDTQKHPDMIKSITVLRVGIEEQQVADTEA